MFRTACILLTTLVLSLSLAHASCAEPNLAATRSDETANSLLSAMKSGNYSIAYEMFDSRMRAAVSVEKLQAGWSAQVAALGPLSSWGFTERSQDNGFDRRLALLKFMKGEMLALISIQPETQEIAGFFIKPAPPPPKPHPQAPYVRPSEFTSQSVSIGSAPFQLGGTLTVPVGLGPFPGAILIHGSGPLDRDETVGGTKVFKDTAEGLASRGIEVLRYDKRTYVYGPRLGDSISVEDEVVSDAIAALSVLRARLEVDSNRVFVIGHSLGALLAPEVGTRSSPVAGVVLLAPPGRPIWDVVLSQMRYLGMPAKDLAEAERQVGRIRTGTLGTERFLGAPQSYWKDVAARDGVASARRLGKPVLVIRGERDYQILEEDIVTWRKGLAGVAGVEIMNVPGANHLLVPGTGKPGPGEYQKPGHVDGRVIDKLAAFMAGSKSQ